MVGDDISVGEFTTDAEVTRIVHEKLKKSEKTKQDSNANLKTEARFKLFAKPGTAEWKGSKKIRGALCEVLGSMGYGRNMPRQYGKGPAPENWPILYPWTDFKRPSMCSAEMCTNLVIALTEGYLGVQEEDQGGVGVQEEELYHDGLGEQEEKLYQDGLGVQEEELNHDGLGVQEEELHQDGLGVQGEEVNQDGLGVQGEEVGHAQDEALVHQAVMLYEIEVQGEEEIEIEPWFIGSMNQWLKHEAKAVHTSHGSCAAWFIQ